MLPYVKAVLVEGDPALAFNTVLAIKQGLGVAARNWVEFIAKRKTAKDADGGDYELKAVCDALTGSDFDDSPHVVLLRGVPGRKEFREGLPNLVPRITAPHTLIIWDEHGVMGTAGWNPLRATCRNHGQVAEMPQPLDELTRDDQIRAICTESAKQGVTLSVLTADVLLGLLGANRALISAAVEDLELMGITKPTDVELRRLVLPAAVDYPVWLFYAAFNTGVLVDTLVAARQLQRNKYPRDIILSFVVRQCRWQLIAAQARLVGKDPAEALRSAGGAKDEAQIAKRLSRYRPDRQMFRTMSVDDLPKRELLTAEPMIHDIANFVTAVMPFACTGVADAKQWVFDQCLERYLIAYQSMVEQREHDSEADFVNALRALSVG